MYATAVLSVFRGGWPRIDLRDPYERIFRMPIFDGVKGGENTSCNSDQKNKDVDKCQKVGGSVDKHYQ